MVGSRRSGGGGGGHRRPRPLPHFRHAPPQRSPHQDLLLLRPPLSVAEEMEGCVARGALVLGALPPSGAPARQSPQALRGWDGGQAAGNLLQAITFNHLHPSPTEPMAFVTGLRLDSAESVTTNQPPINVPGPLPLLAVGARLGWSRRARNRLRMVRGVERRPSSRCCWGGHLADRSRPAR